MSWNLEVACVRVKLDVALGRIVPDIFTPTGAMVCFEDATSVSRGTDLCAAIIGEWAVLIDINCRLSNAGPWLDEVSASDDVFVFRIADSPREVHFRGGKLQSDSSGVTACLLALGHPKSKVRERIDGETVACQLLQARTGLAFTDDFWKVQFPVFALDG